MKNGLKVLSLIFKFLGGGDTKIFSAKFSHDDKYIACGNKFSNNL